jgi:hypothetical protein
MQLSNEEEDYNLSLKNLSLCWKPTKYSFDSEEFEEIILHYLDMGKAALAKKKQTCIRSASKSTG